MRIRLDISYDGTHFRGWARQSDLRTVQGVIEDAIERILGGRAALVVAGRTDAGVHARGQVAHVDLSPAQVARLRPRPGPEPADGVTALARRLQGVLGRYPDVAVGATSVAPDGFDARFSALWRRYEYRLADDLSGYDPLMRLYTTSIRGILDVDQMDAAARALCGLHDFAAFCKPRPEATTIRTLQEFRWIRGDDGVVRAHLQADAFCHNMVRGLVGACSAVGAGQLRVDDVVAVRERRERTSAFKVLAARGLTLTEVGYPDDSELAERAGQTRARREP